MSKDECDAKENTVKSIKNPLHIQQYGQRYFLGWCNVEQWKTQAHSLSHCQTSVSQSVGQSVESFVEYFLRFCSNFLKTFLVNLIVYLGLANTAQSLSRKIMTGF